MLDLARNAALLLGLFFAYSLVRRITAGDLQTAVLNARQIVDFQNAIGLPSEARVQALVLDNPILVKAFNWFYMWGHFPITSAFMVWVFLFRRHAFPLIRDSMIVLTVAGMLLNLLYPLAPPRLLPGFFDTGALFGPSPYDIGVSTAANQLAAMPSLHVGWAMIVAISLIALNSHKYRSLFLLHPLITSVVVVATANHYWIDAIVAILLVFGAWEFSARLAHNKLLQPCQDSEDDPSDGKAKRRQSSPPLHIQVFHLSPGLSETSTGNDKPKASQGRRVPADRPVHVALKLEERHMERRTTSHIG